MNTKVSKRLAVLGVALVAVIGGSLAYSHCQIPCGIYGDEARFAQLEEHFTTIEKSMRLVNELSAEKKPNMNQIVRWVENKEDHANEVGEIITYYFMAQRIKLPPAGNSSAQGEYVKKLTLLHEMLVYAMKCKQTTDVANVEKLRSTLEEFHHAYFAKKN